MICLQVVQTVYILPNSMSRLQSGVGALPSSRLFLVQDSLQYYLLQGFQQILSQTRQRARSITPAASSVECVAPNAPSLVRARLAVVSHTGGLVGAEELGGDRSTTLLGRRCCSPLFTQSGSFVECSLSLLSHLSRQQSSAEVGGQQASRYSAVHFPGCLHL